MANTVPETIDLSGVSPTDLEEHTHPFGAGTFAAKYVLEPLPASFNSKKRIDYVSRDDGQPVYVGFAMRGTDTSSASWVIQKITYDASNNPVSVDIAVDSWDNRASATYE